VREGNTIVLDADTIKLHCNSVIMKLINDIVINDCNNGGAGVDDDGVDGDIV